MLGGGGTDTHGTGILGGLTAPPNCPIPFYNRLSIISASPANYHGC